MKTKLIRISVLAIALRVLLFLSVPVMLAGLWATTAYADTKTSVGTGNWSAAATWSPSGVPATTDNVIIATGTTVTLTAIDTYCGDITINGTGKIIIPDTGILHVYGGGTSPVTTGAVAGNGTIQGNSTSGTQVQLNGDWHFTGTFTNWVSIAFQGPDSTVYSGTNVTFNRNLYLNKNTGATLHLQITPTYVHTLTYLSGNYDYSGGAQIVLPTTYGADLTLSGSGAKTLQTGTTTISGNLTLSGTASATTVVGLGIGGNLNIGDGTTFTAAGFALTVTGTTTVGNGASGTLAISSLTGAKTFTGNVTINNGASWTNVGNSAVSFGGSLTNNGTFNTGTGTQTFSGASAILTNSGTFNGSGSSVTMSGTTQQIVCDGTHGFTVGTLTPTAVTNNCTGGLTVSTSLAAGTTLTQGTNAILNIGGTSGITTLTATASGNTVNYTGAGQTVHSNNYYNLTLSGSGTKTLQTGTTTIGGNLTLSGTASATAVVGLTISGNVTLGSGTTFSAGPSFTHNVSGNWNNNGATFTASTSTINFNGSGAQTIGGTASTTFYNLTINNSSGVTLNGVSVNATVSHTLTLTSGNLYTGSNILIMGSGATSSGTTDVVGTVRRTDLGSTARAFGNPNITITVTSGTAPTQVDLSLALAAPANNTVNRTYTITPTGGSGYLATLQLHYLNSELNGNLASNLNLYWYNGSSWVNEGESGRVTGSEPNNYVYLNGVGPSLLQGTWTLSASAPTAVKLISFTATEYNGKVLLQWRTGYEVDNLGFNIYAEEGGQRYRVTPEMIAGTALLAGAGTPLTAGHPYAWWDFPVSDQSSSGNSTQSAVSSQQTTLSTVKYWLEDIDLNGKRVLHGPVTPVLSQGPLPETVKPQFLSELGKKRDKDYQEFSRIEELKEKLNRKPLKAIKPLSASILQASTATQKKDPTDSSVQPSQQNLTMQWSLAAGPAVKLSVKEEGWYRVSQPDLVAAGLDPRVNPQNLQLFADGLQQPIRVSGDGTSFDPQDVVEFYGTGLDTPSTDTRVYWLVAGSKGQRVQTFTGQGRKGAPLSFPFTVEDKPRTIYAGDLKNGGANKFFGPVVSGALVVTPPDPQPKPVPVDQVLSVHHLDPAPPRDAVLVVALQGATTGPHVVKVLLNNIEVGTMTFADQSNRVTQFTISQTGLAEGDNLVALIAQGGETDVSLTDYIQLTYWHTYTADNDTLKFTAQGGKELFVSNFSNQSVRVVDITHPSALIEVLGTVNPQQTGFSIAFGVPGSGQRTLLAFTDGQIGHPAGIAKNQPSKWHDTKNGADLVIISHGSFIPSLGPLETLRQGQGWLVDLIDVEDLYDEFNFGNKDPQALRDFLSLAKAHWGKAPRFVLLVGDASYDPRNYQGYGNLDFVPTKLVETTYFETASDDWFVDFNGDGLPEMAMGRLSVQTAEEAATVVSKIVAYEQAAADTWTNEVILVADENLGFDFETASDNVGKLLPGNMTVLKIYRGQIGDPTAAEILASFNAGALLVNYFGHGSVDIWGGDGGDLLSNSDASTLTNTPRLPFLVDMTCLNGFFQAPYSDTLAEALLKAPQGGVVAVWASSGLTNPDGQVLMNQKLIQLLFNGQGLTGLTIGEATAQAKAATTDQDVRRTWILFGDPTTKLK